MNAYYLASAQGVDTGGGAPGSGDPLEPYQTRPTISLESMNGLVKIPIDANSGWILMPGAAGLEMPPYTIVSERIPGVPGSVNPDVRVEERPVFLPLYFNGGRNLLAKYEMLDRLRNLVDPTLGTFKVVGESARGIRELTVIYESGLEGLHGDNNDGLTWIKIGLSATALNPYAQDRVNRNLEFRLLQATAPFMGVAGGTDAPFPGIMLASGSVIGSGMPITIHSEVPVHPTLELVGPMTSFYGSLSPVVINPDGSSTSHTDHEWIVDIPLGVPAGQTMRLVTDPHVRSIRLDGALAAGRVTIGSRFRPFYPGQNILNVIAPGGTDETRILLSWPELHRSLW
jgi:hypothetical protein